ncbi:43423_t:CDS:2 [Gigaspora margarita]|uniref:43423_t:CDS:1 n=1 Tax=Gigaspora margarita TaxID=4874 RepID=A0ABN7VHA6_GIGMA|nr:43423_t:CDS:2 [Gigaspora margarita]
MSLHNSTLVTYNSPLMVSQYSSEKTEKEAHPKHSEGRPPDPVWDHFFVTLLKSPSHFSAKCKYCSIQFNRGCPNQLKIHIAKECENENLDNKIREKYQEIVIQRQKLKEKTQVSAAILQLEKANCTMANCFIQLVRLISTIHYIPRERDTITFKNRCIEIVNSCWNELEAEPYILAYILHPEYQGAGLKKGVWIQTALYARTL